MMQDVERVAFAMWKAEAERAAPNVAKNRTLEGFSDESPDTRNKWLYLATAAISAMTPDTALSHALHAGEDVGFARGWNAAIEAAAEACQSHPEEGSEDLGPGIALAIEIIRALKSPKPPIL